jgi:hypothetical protein
MEGSAMRGDEVPGDVGEWLSVKAAVSGLAILYAAALAVGVLDGVPPERPRGRAEAVGRHAAAPVPGLCFRGPGGEPIDFPAEYHCPRAVAARGP